MLYTQYTRPLLQSFLPLLMNFRTLTTTFTLPPSPPSGGVNGLSNISTGSRLLRLGELAVLWKVGRSPVVIARCAIVLVLSRAEVVVGNVPKASHSASREACERRRR